PHPRHRRGQLLDARRHRSRRGTGARHQSGTDAHPTVGCHATQGGDPVSRLLMTGAAGNMGRLLRPFLRRDELVLRLADVVEVDDARPGEEIVVADVTDPTSVTKICQDVDAVLHLGGISTEAPFEEVIAVNVVGTRNVLQAAVDTGVPRVLLASSNHAAGFYRRSELPAGGDGLADEVPARPDTFYGWSKAAIESLAAPPSSVSPTRTIPSTTSWAVRSAPPRSVSAGPDGDPLSHAVRRTMSGACQLAPPTQVHRPPSRRGYPPGARRSATSWWCSTGTAGSGTSTGPGWPCSTRGRRTSSGVPCRNWSRPARRSAWRTVAGPRCCTRSWCTPSTAARSPTTRPPCCCATAP